MIDPEKLYNWLEQRDIAIVQFDHEGSRELDREEWEVIFRQYITELTDQ